MNEILHTLHLGLRGSHIVLGFVGLPVFWAVIFLPKGTATHKKAGTLFYWLALAVGGSAIVSSLWALIHQASFAPWLEQLSDASRPGIAEQLRFLFSVLLFLSAATVTGAIYGRRLALVKEDHPRLRSLALQTWMIGSLAASVWMIAFATHRFATGIPEGAFPPQAYFIPLLLGISGAVSTLSDWRFIRGSVPEPRTWLYKHVEQMLGTGIAFHTAFLVFGANRLFGFQLPGAWAIVPWVGPPAVGTFITFWYVRRLKRRNGDLPKPPLAKPGPSLRQTAL